MAARPNSNRQRTCALMLLALAAASLQLQPAACRLMQPSGLFPTASRRQQPAARGGIDAAALAAGSSLPARSLLAKVRLLGLDRQGKELRVLAFGDSITEGWIDSREVKTPWSPRVQQQLQQKLPGWNVEVVNGGVGSAGVLDRLNDAFRQQLANAKSSGRPFHFITFEAGINDLLLQNKNAPEIFARMQEMWRAANADGATVLVIPTLPTNIGGEREQQREALTGMVRSYIAQQRASGNAGLVLLDLEKEFDYPNLPEGRRRQVFDDGIHMTEYGYQLLGDLVSAGLQKAMGI